MIRLGPGLPAAFTVLLVFLAGCQSTPPLLVSTSGEALPIDDERASEALATYLAGAEARRGMRGSARVAISGPDFKLNRPQRVVVERPARLRFEILGLFDQLAALLVTDGRRFGFFDAASGEISRGRVSRSLLWDLTQIDLAPDEAVGLLLAAPQPSPGLVRAGVWSEPEGRIALAFAWPPENGEGSLPQDCLTDPSRGRFDPTCFLGESALREGGEVFFFRVGSEGDGDDEGDVTLVELRSLDADGVIRYRVFFEQYEKIASADGVNFPMRITVRSPAMESEARFSWKRVMFADELSDRLFNLPARLSAGRRD